MDDFYSRQRSYWDKLSRLDPDASIIDPGDTRGLKNAYLAGMRDRALLSGLKSLVPAHGVLLDFGCGTGSASISLLREGYRVVGLDLSQGLLRQAVARCREGSSAFVAIDGRNLPLQGRSLDAAVTYGVLCYITDDAEAVALLRGICAALRPGAPMLMIEQARTRRTLSEGGLKVQRTTREWSALLDAAGFRGVQRRLLRHGRFPTTPLIRHGLVPSFLWESIARMEAVVGSLTGVWPWDYADVLFESLA